MLQLCLILLTGCAWRPVNEKGYLTFNDPADSAPTVRAKTKQTRDSGEIRCCWVSYLEINPDKLLNEDDYRRCVSGILQPLSRLGITDLFVQVRPFCDAIYPSDLFESSSCVVKNRGYTLPFDYLAVILDAAKEAQMRVHAWINPYRLFHDVQQGESVDPGSAVGKLIKSDNGANIMEANGGVWLQPASPGAQKLILDGVREILCRYKVAGVHIDDYFYPPNTTTQDAAWYEAYRESGGTLSLRAWRMEQVNVLLRSLFRIVHRFDEGLVFSVSPGGNPKADRESGCADVSRWCREPGFCDWIIPQLYYGFHNQTMPFTKTAKQWRTLCREPSVKLIAGLALYKTGKEDPYAGAKGRREWIEDKSVLVKQVRLLCRLGYDGFSLFSAQFVNFQEKVTAKACQNLERVL